jgi:hypothetical protein
LDIFILCVCVAAFFAFAAALAIADHRTSDVRARWGA